MRDAPGPRRAPVACDDERIGGAGAAIFPGMATVSRRQFVAAVPAVLGASVLPACTRGPGAEDYASAAARTWRNGPLPGSGHDALGRELVRQATLAPSSHNTQCWKFSLGENAIDILPDLARRCPAVDPDDHHVFVSLGCASENLAQAALAHGFMAEPRFDAQRNAVRVTLAATPAQASPLFHAIASRQCTRGDYDGQPLSGPELQLLEGAGTSAGVRLLLLADRPAMERVLDYVLQGNAAQMADPAFMRELRSWIRFNGADAVRTRDGLFSVASGSPAMPAWLGDLAFPWFYTTKGEHDRIARQVRSSSGIAVFVGAAADRAHWVEVGRAYERFALQATALGIRNAFLNQPVEVAAVRPPFAAALGLTGQRPDLVVRFGRGPSLPRSLRRPVEAVLA